MANLEALCPSYVGDMRIRLTLAPDAVIQVGRLLDVYMSAEAALPDGGLVLPLDMLLLPPSGARVLRVYRRFVPRSFVLRIDEPGPHSLLVRERYHNRFQGRLQFTALEG